MSTVKEGLQKYCDKAYSTSGVDQMWILKNSKDLLQYIKSDSLKLCTSIQMFDFQLFIPRVHIHNLKTVLRNWFISVLLNKMEIQDINIWF